MISKEQILIRTLEVIKNKYTHKWYKRSVELAEDLTAYITGEGLDEMLKRLVMRESEEAFEQREKITEHILPAVSKTLMDVAYKVPRSNGMKRLLEYPDNKTRLEDLQNIMDKFWGTSSWDDYMAVRFIELNYIDPNSFVVFEWEDFDNKINKAQPYPFEVSSKMAVDYFYDNEVLLYLLVLANKFKFDTSEDAEQRHTLYLKDQTVIFEKVDFKGKESEKETQEEFAARILVDFGIKDDALDKKLIPSKSTFILLGIDVYKVVFIEPHKLNEVPAFQVGIVPDLYTDRKMFRNLFNAAIPYMRKTIKTVSEMDLTMALHAFPQKITYRNPCTNCKGAGRINDGPCPPCKGMGYQIITTAQDSITLAMPPNATPDQLADLTKLVHYVYPPVEGMKFQDEFIDKLERKCIKAVYGNNAIRKEQVNITATESLVDESKTYDALHPLTKKYSKSWMKGTNLIAKITDLDKGLDVKMSFSKDLKFLNKEDYIKTLKDLQGAGASEESKNIVQNEIIRLDYAENPLQMARFKTKDFFMPFSNKTESETIVIIGTLSKTNTSKVLWMFFEEIFNAIELEHKIAFYELTREAQTPIVDEFTEAKVKELEAEEPEPIPFEDEKNADTD